MDNAKTGAFIRQLRTELSMTQKQLAERLHISDRAVSKWERGLNAPDISLLEPLADALSVTVLELIRGERDPSQATPEAESAAKDSIGYCEAAIKDVQRGQRRRYAAVIAAVILLWVVVLGFSALWNSGAFFKLDELSSPDGRYIASVYGKEITFSHFLFRHRVQTGRDALTLIIDEGGSTASNISYGDSEYLGSWWSPDSEKYVLALRQNGETRLELYWPEQHSVSNLNAYLSMGVSASELALAAFEDVSDWPEVEYGFVRWAEDGANMLIRYSFTDNAGAGHSGYFWYDCETVSVSAVLEI